MASTARYHGFTKAAFTGWSGYLRLAVPGVLLLSEYWIGEALVLAASRLPDPNTVLSALSRKPPGAQRRMPESCCFVTKAF